MTVEYLNASEVSEVKITDTPRSGQTISGYGSKIPTRYMLKIGNRWHRVYAMVYGNSGSSYVLRNREVYFLNSDTEYRIERFNYRQKLINDDVWVCEDCYYAHHTGENYPATYDNSVDWTDNTNSETGEGIEHFSHSTCKCCGSILAGARYRMAIWERKV